jgi:hypothetical protein
MRNAGWWSILWSDRIVELAPDLPLWVLGAEAIDALSRRAPRCTVSRWVLDWPIFKEKIPHWEWPMMFERLQLVDLPFEQFAAGGMLQSLMRSVGAQSPKARFPQEPVAHERLTQIMRSGVERGLSALSKQLVGETEFVANLARSRFAFDR